MKKKLKLLITLGVAAMLSFGAAAFAACGEESKGGTHEHVWSEYETTTEATCMQEGEQTRHCLVEGCTEAPQTKVVPKKPHSWGSLENTATCTEGGVMRKQCKREGCKAYQDADVTLPLGHDFELKEENIIEPAKCTEDGSGKYTCTRCTASETRPIAMLGHKFDSNATTEPATCEEEGVIHGKCVQCDNIVDQPIPALGHNWKKDRVIKQATCTEDGSESYFCLRGGCGKDKVETVLAFGHSYENSTIIYATFDAPGSETGHCKVCDKDVTTVLPQLEEGMEINYQFKILRNNGDLVGSPSMKIVVTDKDGQEVASGVDGTLYGTQYYGIINAKLPVHRGEVYTMTVTGLYSGYTANQTSVAVSPEHPVGEYKITAHLIGKSERSPSKYEAGSIMQDFDLKLIDGTQTSLSELLAKNKVVMLNIFGVDCFWCKAEFPGLHKAYKNYKDRGIEVVAMAPYSPQYNTLSEQDVINYMTANEFTFPAVYMSQKDPLFNLNSKFGLSGYPASIFIDHEGVVNYIHPGAMILDPKDQEGKTSQAGFEMLFEICANWEWPDFEKTAAASVKEGLELAMLRGDYLPCNED